MKTNETELFGSASQVLRETVENYFDAWLELNPTEATRIGDMRFNDKLGNPASSAYIDAMKQLHDDVLAQLADIDVTKLNPQDATTYNVFRFERQLYVDGLQFPFWLFPVNQMDSLVATMADFGSGEGAQPFDSYEDHLKWLTRAAEFPAFVDAAIEQMALGIDKGYTLPRDAIADLIPQLTGLLDGELEESHFYAPIRNSKILDDNQRKALAASYEKLIVGALNPALLRLRHFLQTQYVPAARTTVGWSNLPNGRAWYALEIRRMTTTAMSAEEIHTLGIAEVNRIRSEMTDVKNAVGFTRSLDEFFVHLREDPQYVFLNPASVLDAYQKIRARIDSRIPELFRTKPKADYEIREVEAYRAPSQPGAMYFAPSEDGSRPGIFYVNTYNLKAQPTYGCETLSLHEAVPGHHFQIAIQQELSHLPRFRRFANYNAYAEGWALYAESLGKELGLFQDPMNYYGRLNDEQLRAMRLVVDTGLHAFGWSKQKAVDFMKSNSSLALSDIEAEVERYMVWPGQALGYKLGEFRIRAMRNRAHEKLAARFDVRDFHDVILNAGAMPLSILDDEVDRYIADVLAH